MEQQFVCPSHKTHYITAFVLGVLIGGGILYYLGYQQGFNTAKDRVLNDPMGASLRPVEDLRTFSGVVSGVTGTTLTLKMHQTNPFIDPSLAERTITITPDTKITKRSLSDMEAYQKAMDAFMEKPSGTPPTPPEPTFTTISLSDIKTDDTIVVTTGDNIATIKSFPALTVEVQ